jgi:AcrR family transcriptional regulator
MAPYVTLTGATDRATAAGGCLGIRRDSLYDTFGEKRALFFAAIDRYDRVVSAKLLAALKEFSR